MNDNVLSMDTLYRFTNDEHLYDFFHDQHLIVINADQLLLLLKYSQRLNYETLFLFHSIERVEKHAFKMTNYI